MTTILLYLSILIFSTFFVYISEKGKGNLERIVFLSIAFLIIFIPAAIRDGIGTDFYNYVNIYYNLDSNENLEPTYYFINWFLNRLGAHHQWIFIVSALIFTLAAFISYPKKNAWLFHFSVMTMLWFFSLNGIRQAISVAICLIAISNFFEKKYWAFFLLTFLAATFHTSAIFILAIGALALIPLRKNLQTKILPYIFIGFIFFSYISLNLIVYNIEFLLNLTGFTQYSYYFNSRFFQSNEAVTGLGVIAKLAVSVYVILNTKQILAMNRQYWLFILLTVAYAVATVLASEVIIFVRMQNTFVLAQILTVYILYKLPENKQMNRLVLTFFMIFLLLTYVKSSIGSKTVISDPMTNPYKSIFYDRLNEFN